MKNMFRWNYSFVVKLIVENNMRALDKQPIFVSG
jgi:hypothetical protein